MCIFALIVVALLAASKCNAASNNTIYIIGTAERPSLGLPGLTPVGQQRADSCIPDVFGSSSSFDIGLIVACEPNDNNGHCVTGSLTVQPLADALGVTVDTSCGPNSNDNCIHKLIKDFSTNSSQNILISWPSDDVDDLTDDLNVNDTPDFPGGHHDVIFTIRNSVFISQTSQNCPGIDGQSTESESTFGASPLDNDDNGVAPSSPPPTDPVSDSNLTNPLSGASSTTDSDFLSTTVGGAGPSSVVSNLFETLTSTSPDADAPTATPALTPVDAEATANTAESTFAPLATLQTQKRRSLRMHRQMRSKLALMQK